MLKLSSVKDQTYLVFGFGKSGQAASSFLQANGARVLVWDDKDTARHLAAQAGYALLPDPDHLSKEKFNGVVLSPGIFLSHKIVVQARKHKIPVINDIDFLFRACPKATFVGVTGTNGKSTTTALITHILSQSGRKVHMGGNIGTPALSLPPLEEDGIYVLELSSYQLDLLKTHPISIAVLLNITPDHIDHHGSMEGYIAAKKNLAQTKTKQTFILGTDEPETQELKKELALRGNLTLIELSATHDVEKGIRIKDHKLYSTEEGLKPIDMSPCKTLVGTHNAQNAAAAFAACRALGLKASDIEKGLQSFQGLAHRQQLVATLKGLRFINDSKATNADAASKALAAYNTIYWIAGGVPKEGGLSGLEAYMSRVVHAFLIGQAEEDFAAWCEGKVSFSRNDTLDKALAQAARMAWEDGKKDACVLLSPACASFDQYESYEKRGEHFADLVHALTRENA
ncbi:MAG: UDP-N-acetylmuramoyl-L-alanine--D-glutamate ligase [Proteobacteria bacterium]|nr:UDP-N-acetylmuramoyl-L-alanine--D-glutamate ligase [Pseudomonadota bacterium]